jgi:hypothetical protein
MACLASNFSGRRNPPTPPRPPRGAKIAFQLPICRPELPQQQTRPHSAVSAWLTDPMDPEIGWAVCVACNIPPLWDGGTRRRPVAICMAGAWIARRAPSGAGGWLAMAGRDEALGSWVGGGGGGGGPLARGAGGHKAATPRILHGDW